MRPPSIEHVHQSQSNYDGSPLSAMTAWLLRSVGSSVEGKPTYFREGKVIYGNSAATSLHDGKEATNPPIYNLDLSGYV